MTDETRREKTFRPQNASKIKEATDEGWVAARALYQSTPGITLRQVAKECGIAVERVRKRAGAEGWSKKFAGPDNSRLNEAAHALADRYIERVEALGPEVTLDQRTEVAKELVFDNAAEARSKLIERHRDEWKIINKLVGEHVNARDFERAKLSKITAETLKIKQEGERKAWGIDRIEDAKGHTVVIERDA